MKDTNVPKDIIEFIKDKRISNIYIENIYGGKNIKYDEYLIIKFHNCKNFLSIRLDRDCSCVSHFYIHTIGIKKLIGQKINDIRFKYEIDPEEYYFINREKTSWRKSNSKSGYHCEYNLLKINDINICTRNQHNGYYPGGHIFFNIIKK